MQPHTALDLRIPMILLATLQESFSATAESASHQDSDDTLNGETPDIEDIIDAITSNLAAHSQQGPITLSNKAIGVLEREFTAGSVAHLIEANIIRNGAPEEEIIPEPDILHARPTSDDPEADNPWDCSL